MVWCPGKPTLLLTGLLAVGPLAAQGYGSLPVHGSLPARGERQWTLRFGGALT